MKFVVFLISLNVISLMWDRFTSIHTSNTLREVALERFVQRDYLEASKALEELLYQKNHTDDELKLNLSLCYEKLKRYSEAKAIFQQLSTSADPAIRSQALLHLGVMIADAKKELALNYFRQALKANPDNEEARYNFELLKKLSPPVLPESQKRENDQGKNAQQMKMQDQQRPQESQDRQSAANDQQHKNETQLNEEGKSRGDALSSERLQHMNLSDRQAKQILESLRQSEIQYIQQVKRTNTTSSSYKGPEY